MCVLCFVHARKINRPIGLGQEKNASGEYAGINIDIYRLFIYDYFFIGLP
ncbi:Uncharacterised protein [Yersinia enterocolitica]|nr:Uncharacterised protein [Yersinia enterocolitica]